MLDNIFLTVLNMSFIGSIVVLIVLLTRLLLRKAPKVFSYALWSVVLFRLLCPFSFESGLSLLPTTSSPIPTDIVYQAVPKIDTGVTAINNAINQSLPASAVGASVNPMQVWIFLGSLLWLLGIALMLAYSVFSLIRLKRRLEGAERDKDNIYLSACIDTPFVKGLIRPKIYLPQSLSATEKEYILLHEQTHIRRFDHVVKIVSFFALCLHWFNPFVWVAFFLSGKDMEMSCDEAVIKTLGTEVKKDYSASLLCLATGRRIVCGTPLAFGEGDTKSRIKNVLGYKKPAFWVLAAALVCVIILCIGFSVNPKSNSGFTAANYRADEILYDAPQFSFTYTVETAPLYSISSDYMLYRKEHSEDDWTMLNSLYVYPLSREERYELFDSLNNKAQENLDQVKMVYRADINDESETFILVMEQKNGDVLLAHGYGASVRWLFKLKKIEDKRLSASELWQSRTKYIGDNSAIGNMISGLTFPDGVTYDGFELHTSEHPYAVTVKFKTDTETRNYYTGALHEAPFQINACIMFSLIENAEYITFSLDDGISEPYSMQYTVDLAESIVGADLWEESKTLAKFEKLLERIDNHVLSAVEPALDISPVIDATAKALEADAEPIQPLSQGAAYSQSLTPEALEQTEKIARNFFTNEAPYYEGVVSIRIAPDDYELYQNVGIEADYQPGNIIIYKVLTGKDKKDGNPERSISIARAPSDSEWKIINQGH
ncbi:M56 family metallopeptidase [Oscillospiraceae bacterium PP1C4]